MITFQNCPRCGVQSIEHLQTHTYCMECNLVADDAQALNEWHRLEFRNPRSTKEQVRHQSHKEFVYKHGAVS